MKEQVQRGEPPRAELDPYGAAARTASELARVLHALGDAPGAAAAARAARQALELAAERRVRRSPPEDGRY